MGPFDEWDDAKTPMGYSKITMRMEDDAIVKEYVIYVDGSGANHIHQLLKLLARDTDHNRQQYVNRDRFRRLREEQDRLRKEQERLRKQKQAEEEARKKYQEARDRPFFDGNWDDFVFSDFNRGYGYSRTYGTSNANRSGNVPPRPKVKSVRDQITELSGVDHLGLTDLQLTRRAQRACHPDTGGSHEKWLALEALLKRL